MPLGQVGKLRSVTTPKLASWNVHEQSFLVGRVLEINQKKISIFFRARDVPPTKPSRTPMGYAVPL